MKALQQTDLALRRSIYSGLVLFMFLVLVYGFVRLQVTNRIIYQQKSFDNSVRRIQVYPVRGLIRDRSGQILVDSRPCFSVAVIPKAVSKENLNHLINFLSLNPAEVKQELNKFFGFKPIMIAHDISAEQVIYLEENRLNMPGVLITVEPKRHYPENVHSPHVFGAMGEVSSTEQVLHTSYEPGDLIGKSGLERTYDLDIRGLKGVEYRRVDATGRELGNYDINRNVVAIHGNDLYLHMEYRLQAFADSLFVDKRGALVAIDVRNGGILALVSKPDYDPRQLSGKIDPQIWKQLIENPGHPLYNRAVQSTYPPGSTYKIVTAVAALQEGIITPQWHASCPGYFKLGRRIIKCWNAKGHGTLDLEGAIKNSCNVYFAQLGLKIGLDNWAKYSKKFGFGAVSGIDLPNENSGLIPTPQYYDKVFGKNGWTNGNMANLAIGQGELLTTPLQMAKFAMILATKGVYRTPHLVDRIYNYFSHDFLGFPVETKYVTGVSDEVYTIVRDGMREVMTGGTGRLGKVTGIDMAGKTGTAQNPHGDPHAWFFGFAPFDYPEVAIAVIIENAGGGGANAAPIARQVLEMYFYGKQMKQMADAQETNKRMQNESQLPIININNIRPMQIIPADRNR